MKKNWTAILVIIIGLVLLIRAGSVESKHLKTPEVDKVPKRHKDKHMPKGWWTDPDVIAEGKKVYEGKANPDVKCAKCHNPTPDAKPKLKDALNWTNKEYVNKMTDSYMFWRVMDGIPDTPMDALGKKLTEDQVWKAIAYAHTISHGGKAEEHNH